MCVQEHFVFPFCRMSDNCATKKTVFGKVGVQSTIFAHLNEMEGGISLAARHAKSKKRFPVLLRKYSIVVILTISAVACLGYYALHKPIFRNSHAQSRNALALQPPPKSIGHLASSKRLTVLVMGTDTRPNDSGGNSDVLMVVSLDRQHNRIEMLSIPRDTRVFIPTVGYRKINQSLALGGPNLTLELVSQLIQEPIAHFATIRFQGLVDTINALGGVTMNVPKSMYYNTGDRQYGVIYLKKGLQHLTGEQALGFVRYRHDELGDIGRTERQQVFVSALTKEILQPANITKLPKLVGVLASSITSDMNVLDLTDIFTDAHRYQNQPILHETLPGSFQDPQAPGYPSYWFINPNQSAYVTKQLFQFGKVQSNPIQDLLTTQKWLPPDATNKPSAPVNRNG